MEGKGFQKCITQQGEFISGIGLDVTEDIQKKPLEQVVIFGIGAGVGAGLGLAGKGAAAIGTRAAATFKGAEIVGGVGLIGFEVFQTGKEIIKAKTTLEKGGIFGTSAKDLALFGEGTVAGGRGLNKIFGFKFISGIGTIKPKISPETGKRVLPDVPGIGDITLLERGEGFGFSRAEQAKFIGKTGFITTSARGFFEPFKTDVIVKEGKGGLGLFATPFELPGGGARTRISRLGAGGREATLSDILRGKFSFVEGKPQIIVFPVQTVGAKGGFKPFGLPSGELEITLPPSHVV